MRKWLPEGIVEANSISDFKGEERQANRRKMGYADTVN